VKQKVHHIKKFADGKETPEEMHRRLAFAGGKCLGCGGPPAIRIKTFAPVDEMVKRNPGLVARLMAMNPNGPFLPTVKTVNGEMLLISNIYACDRCKVTAEKQAAKGPSWVLVDIDRGPPKMSPVSQVPINSQLA
jgi:hypothetical protein